MALRGGSLALVLDAALPALPVRPAHRNWAIPVPERPDRCVWLLTSLLSFGQHPFSMLTFEARIHHIPASGVSVDALNLFFHRA